MNRQTQLVVLAASLLSVVSSVAQAQITNATELIDETAFRTNFVNEVKALVNTEKFDELDRLADELRRSRPRFPGGYPKLCVFYDALCMPPEKKEDRFYQQRLELFQRWINAHPDSVSARIALADAQIDYAWFARGSGWASSVTEEGWRLFKERLNLADATLRQAEAMPVKDAELYCIWMTVARGLAWPRKRFDELFEKAVAIDPAYYEAYFAKAEYLLPRWFGEPGDWQKFAAEAAARTRTTEGESLYARIVWSKAFGHGRSGEFAHDEKYFVRNHLSWSKLKRGFADMDERYPNSLRMLNVFCWFACMANDRETADLLFQRLGNRYDETYWTEAQSRKWRLWADPKTPKAWLMPRAALRWPPAPETPRLVERLRRLLATDGRSAQPEWPWPAWLQSLAISPDDKLIAVGAYDQRGLVVVWNVSDDTVQNVFHAGKGPDCYVAFSPDGKCLATASTDEKKKPYADLRLWELATGMELTQLQGHSEPIHALTFSPNGKMLATAGGHNNKSGEICLWEMTTHKCERLDFNLERASKAIVFSPDGNLLAFTCNQCVAVWDLRKHEFVQGKFHHRGSHQPAHSQECTSLAFSPDGKTLASADWSGTIKLWDPTTGLPSSKEIKGRNHPICSIRYSPDGQLLASCGQDETARLWSTTTCREVATLVGHWDNVTGVAFSPDGKTLVTCGGDSSVRLWDVVELLKADKGR